MKTIEKILSEETLTLHNAYLDTLRAKYSVMEKCYPMVKNKDFVGISRIKEGKLGEDKRKILRLKAEILCHEIYFDSFGEKYQTSLLIKRKYKSESVFLYSLYKECIDSDAKFTAVGIERGCIFIKQIHDYLDILKNPTPLLAIDLCEHAYFNDYRFDKEAYIERAIGYLNLKRLDNFEKEV